MRRCYTFWVALPLIVVLTLSPSPNESAIGCHEPREHWSYQTVLFHRLASFAS